MTVVKAWNLLSNGSGAMDWSGLPVVVEMLGIADPARLITSIQLIKEHRPDKADAEDETCH